MTHKVKKMTDQITDLRENTYEQLSNDSTKEITWGEWWTNSDTQKEDYDISSDLAVRVSGCDYTDNSDAADKYLAVVQNKVVVLYVL